MTNLYQWPSIEKQVALFAPHLIGVVSTDDNPILGAGEASMIGLPPQTILSMLKAGMLPIQQKALSLFPLPQISEQEAACLASITFENGVPASFISPENHLQYNVVKIDHTGFELVAEQRVRFMLGEDAPANVVRCETPEEWQQEGNTPDQFAEGILKSKVDVFGTVHSEIIADTTEGGTVALPGFTRQILTDEHGRFVFEIYADGQLVRRQMYQVFPYEDVELLIMSEDWFETEEGARRFVNKINPGFMTDYDTADNAEYRIYYAADLNSLIDTTGLNFGVASIEKVEYEGTMLNRVTYTQYTGEGVVVDTKALAATATVYNEAGQLACIHYRDNAGIIHASNVDMRMYQPWSDEMEKEAADKQHQMHLQVIKNQCFQLLGRGIELTDEELDAKAKDENFGEIFKQAYLEARDEFQALRQESIDAAQQAAANDTDDPTTVQ